MATWVGHGILGYGVGRVAGLEGWGLLGCAALANAPDLLAGLILKGDAGAFHRMWWNHSPIIVVYGFVGVLIVHAGGAVLSSKRIDARRLRRDTLVVGTMLLTHVVADYVIVNPAVMVPVPPIEDFARAAGRQVLLLLTDLLLYGLVVGVAWLLFMRARGQRMRLLPALRQLLP